MSGRGEAAIARDGQCEPAGASLPEPYAEREAGLGPVSP